MSCGYVKLNNNEAHGLDIRRSGVQTKLGYAAGLAGQHAR